MSLSVFKYEQDIGKTYNRNFFVRGTEDGSRWVGKISNSLKEKGVDFRDLNERSLLAHRLANLLRLPFTPYKIVPASQVAGLDLVPSPKRINDMVWLSKYSGIPLPDYLEYGSLRDIKNPETLWQNVVFNVWVGNYDRKDGDYLVNEHGYFSFIDYHLWGPGFHAGNLLALGAYAESYSLDDPNDTGWCVGAPRLLQYVRERQVSLELLVPMINRIEALPPSKIEMTLNELSFTNQDGETLSPKLMLHYLVTRKHMIRNTLEAWISADYPKGERPKDPEHGDDIYKGL